MKTRFTSAFLLVLCLGLGSACFGSSETASAASGIPPTVLAQAEGQPEVQPPTTLERGPSQDTVVDEDNRLIYVTLMLVMSLAVLAGLIWAVTKNRKNRPPAE